MATRKKYDQVNEGEWFRVLRGGHKMACCDCGLVHKFYFRTREGDLELKATRDDRATGQIRRHMKKPTTGGE